MKVVATVLLAILGAPVLYWRSLEPLHRNHPDIMLSASHDILNEDDLAMYWDVPGSSLRRWTFFPVNSDARYWVCLPTAGMSLKCKDLGYDDPPMGTIDLVLKNGPIVEHRFGMRHGVGMEVCLAQLHEWQDLLNGQDYVCVGGQTVAPEVTTVHGNLRIVYGWVFDKLKTQRGCTSWWPEDCDIQDHLKRGELKGYRPVANGF